MMVDPWRARARLLAALAILLLGGTLCLFDEDGAGVDLCIVAALLAVGPLVVLALEPSGAVAAVCISRYQLPPPDLRSPPPKSLLALA